jgi:hypothetical protein
MEGAAIAEEAAAAAVAVPVALHSLGRFSLKGVPEPVAVAQLVPLVLEGRLGQLLPPHLVNKVRGGTITACCIHSSIPYARGSWMVGACVPVQ